MPDRGKAKSAKDENVDRQKLGARLREAREYLGLSQDDVAKYLNIPRTALSHIESGQRGVDSCTNSPSSISRAKANRMRVCPRTSHILPARPRDSRRATAGS